MIHKLKPDVTRDEKFARLAWARVLKGNAEGAVDYVDPASLRYVEASQLAYTLTRPDVYNAIMALPGDSQELERELGVDKSKGMNSYDYMVTYEAITVDSRFMWRARMSPIRSGRIRSRSSSRTRAARRRKI